MTAPGGCDFHLTFADTMAETRLVMANRENLCLNVGSGTRTPGVSHMQMHGVFTLLEMKGMRH
jgi:hypothetical protein